MKTVFFTVTFLLVFRPVFPVVSYFIDYDYIATVLCINRDKPELECHGKCHLMKELGNAAEEDQQIHAPKKSAPIEFAVLFVNPIEAFAWLAPPLSLKKPFATYLNTYFKLNTSGVFRPPLWRTQI
ncbi:hypothetical protein [Flavobacterium sp. JP2137]|uniref:hypothetical protein n=1 Tax=Flavobacterium sp. JP2137 TaxID=3414510 RepID=UPI003D2F9E6E